MVNIRKPHYTLNLYDKIIEMRDSFHDNFLFGSVTSKITKRTERFRIISTQQPVTRSCEQLYARPAYVTAGNFDDRFISRYIT